MEPTLVTIDKTNKNMRNIQFTGKFLPDIFKFIYNWILELPVECDLLNIVITYDHQTGEHTVNVLLKDLGLRQLQDQSDKFKEIQELVKLI